MQIFFESGVVNVADPLGGSYYTEWLTDKLEKEIVSIMDEYKENLEKKQ
ncbi:methylmalonyl-CoA mutase family protein [Thermodesulfobacteriota bacterium]